jgi:DNA-binding GntR family transcriptional regulator
LITFESDVADIVASDFGFAHLGSLIHRIGKIGAMIDDKLSADVTVRICSALCLAIAEGALKPGTKILDDVIASHFGVSRTVARGAIAILERERVIDRKRNRGAFVATPSLEEARHLLEARLILELAIVDRAVVELSEKEMDRLQELTLEEDLVHGSHDPAAKSRISGNFHIELARATGNTVYVDILQNLVARLTLVAALYEIKSSDCCGSNDHRAILEALRQREKEKARAIMKVHLERIEATIDLSGGSDDNISLSSVLAKFAPAT